MINRYQADFLINKIKSYTVEDFEHKEPIKEAIDPKQHILNMLYKGKDLATPTRFDWDKRKKAKK